jgi:hypothetical protein
MITAILHEHGMQENLHGFVGEDNGDAADWRDYLHAAMIAAQDSGQDAAARAIHKLLDPSKRNGANNGDDEDELVEEDDDDKEENTHKLLDPSQRENAREGREERHRLGLEAFHNGRSLQEQRRHDGWLKRFVRSLKGT